MNDKTTIFSMYMCVWYDCTSMHIDMPSASDVKVST